MYKRAHALVACLTSLHFKQQTELYLKHHLAKEDAHQQVARAAAGCSMLLTRDRKVSSWNTIPQSPCLHRNHLTELLLSRKLKSFRCVT